MSKIENPVWGTADTDLVHVTEAPPTNYSFLPEAACGNGAITGERKRKSDFPKGTDFCASCEDLMEPDKPKTTEGTKPKPGDNS